MNERLPSGIVLSAVTLVLLCICGYLVYGVITTPTPYQDMVQHYRVMRPFYLRGPRHEVTFSVYSNNGIF